MRAVLFTLCLGISIVFTGCTSHRTAALQRREAERQSVRQDMARLEAEQAELLRAVTEARQRWDRIRLATPKVTALPTQPANAVMAEAEVISMTRTEQAPFRFLGRLKMHQPVALAGREVEGLLLSHERDLSTLSGQMIRVATYAGVLEQQLMPMGPFSVNNHATLAAEEKDGVFQQFDEARYASPVVLTGHVLAFEPDPENKSGYFIFETLYTGDMATVVIESPARYRGTRLRVLVESDATASRDNWAKVGAPVQFSTAETTVAWEPWGFTRAADLKDVSFLP